MRFDALVIGGGPAGATAAILLAKAGWSVAVVEKQSFPRRKVCGEFVSAGTLPSLDRLGVGEAFRFAAGPHVRRIGLFAGETVVASPLTSSRANATSFGRALGRETLDNLLLERAAQAGAEIWQPWKAAALARDGAGWVCTLAARGKTATLAARLVIAANGSWERGPFGKQVATPHRVSDLLAFKAHFDECELPPGLMPLLAFPGGYGGMVASDRGRVTLSCCIRRDAMAALRPRLPGTHAGDAVLAHIVQSCRGVREALARARLDGAWLSAGPLRPGIRQRYANGVFAVGNAAGEAHPAIAEGISMAIQSASLLSDTLIASGSALDDEAGVAHAGAAYSAAWRRRFGRRLRAAQLFAHLAMRPGAAGALLQLTERFPHILTLGAHLAGKTAQAA